MAISLTTRTGVPGELVAQMLEDSRLSRSEAARALGWYEWHYDNRYTTRVRRRRPAKGRVAKMTRQKMVSYERAERACLAWGLDPVTYGI